MKKPLIALAVVFALVAIGRNNDKSSGPFEITKSSVSGLAFACSKLRIKPVLKDPSSFREIDHSYTSDETHIYVTVNYTATNSFGGRVRGTKTCNSTL